MQAGRVPLRYRPEPTASLPARAAFAITWLQLVSCDPVAPQQACPVPSSPHPPSAAIKLPGCSSTASWLLSSPLPTHVPHFPPSPPRRCGWRITQRYVLDPPALSRDPRRCLRRPLRSAPGQRPPPSRLGRARSMTDFDPTGLDRPRGRRRRHGFLPTHQLLLCHGPSGPEQPLPVGSSPRPLVVSPATLGQHPSPLGPGESRLRPLRLLRLWPPATVLRPPPAHRD